MPTPAAPHSRGVGPRAQSLLPWLVGLPTTAALATVCFHLHAEHLTGMDLAIFDVHEVALGMPLLAMALDGALRRRRRMFTAFSLALLLVKEDAGLLVLGLALVAFVLGARRLAACWPSLPWPGPPR